MAPKFTKEEHAFEYVWVVILNSQVSLAIDDTIA